MFRIIFKVNTVQYLNTVYHLSKKIPFEVIPIGIQDRKEREKNEKRKKILQAAAEIMRTEGAENISIRKIADKIEYSPANVYHYFMDKEDIINQIIMSTYRQIVDKLSLSLSAANRPEEKLKTSMRTYIELMTGMADEYKIMMLSESSAILKHTSVLFQGASASQPAMGMLHQTLREIWHEQGLPIEDSRIELTAQVIWTSMFGLILRLITEKVEEKQKQRLIDHFLEFTLCALPHE
ncbi:TetR/AcrR family transcriptional regulator [uncultured Paenibacillus sp.]|uniref:TetR/AcrR family transcriptional regulator n=1 Tax=uncultured Paenibacillus sp. TaxID=227322 RepID=UPI002804EC0E|nr:TetR/AcrR family transcriptional regulator [uncultured Paenibacillus sp.]